MVENKSSLVGIIAIIISASGLGLGVFSNVNFQVVEGPPGPPGADGQDGIDGTNGLDGLDGTNGLNGTDGQDAAGGLVVGILDPDQGDVVWGEIIIRALVYGSNNYSISVKANLTEIGAILPTFWNTSSEVEGWYNLTVIIMDNETNLTASDTVWILVESPVSPGVQETYTLTRSGENLCSDWYYGWVSVFDMTGLFADMWVDVEEGEVLHLSFTGWFREPVAAQYYSFCFFDVGTYGPIAVPDVEYVDDSYRLVTLEKYVFFMTPGLHRIDVCIYDPWIGFRDKDLSLTIETLVL